MKLFSNTRIKRSTALMVLLVWVFALASGVANACLLEAHGGHGRSTAADAAHATSPPALPAGHGGAVADHEGDSHDSTDPCLKSFDDSGLSVLKPSSGPDLTHPGPAFAVAFAWPVAPPVVVAFRRLDDLQPAASGPPIRVRYSRLSI